MTPDKYNQFQNNYPPGDLNGGYLIDLKSTHVINCKGCRHEIPFKMFGGLNAIYCHYCNTYNTLESKRKFKQEKLKSTKVK